MNFKHIAVIGAGTMGRDIAQMLAERGLEVLLFEKSAKKLDQMYELIEVALEREIEKWVITSSEKKLILSRIHKAYDWDRIRDAEMVIETVTEDLDLKKDIFRKLDALCREDCILASITSTLSLTELANETRCPERVIGLHFLHPVAKIDLVEIIRGLKTSDRTFQETRAFVENVIQKKGIMVYESPGFVTTRLICVLINEALHALSEGIASAEDIDQAMRIGYDFHYGPLEMADRFGLDSVLLALERMFREFGELKYRPSFLLKKMVRAGHLGVKTGQGFFKYDKDGDRIG